MTQWVSGQVFGVVDHRHSTPSTMRMAGRALARMEKTHFIGSGLEDALPELKGPARLSGAEAIIEIQEQRSQVGETKIYHVTAVGIRYR